MMHLFSYCGIGGDDTAVVWANVLHKPRMYLPMPRDAKEHLVCIIAVSVM
jgi:hypothetical protein